MPISAAPGPLSTSADGSSRAEVARMKKPWLDGGGQPGPFAVVSEDGTVDPATTYE